MPVLAVKSLPSSTSALAGSHAAQHKVNCLAAAGAGPARHDATMTAVAPNARIVRIIKSSLLSQALCACPATHTSSCTQFGPDPRGKSRRCCLVLLLSERLSLNTTAVNRLRRIRVIVALQTLLTTHGWMQMQTKR